MANDHFVFVLFLPVSCQFLKLPLLVVQVLKLAQTFCSPKTCLPIVRYTKTNCPPPLKVRLTQTSLCFISFQRSLKVQTGGWYRGCMISPHEYVDDAFRGLVRNTMLKRWVVCRWLLS